MQVGKLLPSGLKAIPIVAALALGTGAVCSAQNNNSNENTVEVKVSDDTIQDNKDSKTLNFDVAARTFQFMDGSNMSCVSTGVSKNWDNLSGYFTVFGGYSSADKLPLLGTMGFLEYSYPIQTDNFNVGAELYHESTLNNNGFIQKFAVTPTKLSKKINGNVNVGLDPRMAFNVISGKIIPKFEVYAMTTIQMCKNLSAYIIGQIYDITQPSVPGNYSVNAGVIKQF